MEELMHALAGAMEFKFVDAAGTALPPGEFRGYGAVFGNVDSHGDVIEPGAFAETLAQRKAQGRGVPMHVMHGFLGGDGLPVGVWKSLEEDDKGLRVHGKISGMGLDAGKLLWERLQDGAFGGFSIGYKVAKDGAEQRGGKRHLKRIALHEISLVDDPSNALAKIDEMKRARGLDVKTTLMMPQTSKAAASVAAAMALHSDCLTGNDSPTADERAALMTHLQDAHEHLTGMREPNSGNAAPLAEAVKSFGFLENFRL